MQSHIGFESAVGMDCWTLTRSLLADNSPYFETGVRVSYTSKSERWYFAGLYLNGWQRIQRPDANNTPAFGTQLTYRPSKKLTFNWSSFAGSDKPDSARQMRYFNNLYAIWQPTAKLGLTLDFDYGVEQRSKESSQYNEWYGAAGIMRYQASDSWSVGARAEYYYDPAQIIVNTGYLYGLKCSGYSLNLDYQVLRNALLRLEGKLLSNEDNLFENAGKPVNSNTLFAVALAVSL
jgi:hypothetical protein